MSERKQTEWQEYYQWRIHKAPASVTFAEVVSNQSCPYVCCQAARGTACFRSSVPHKSRIEAYYGALYDVAKLSGDAGAF